MRCRRHLKKWPERADSVAPGATFSTAWGTALRIRKVGAARPYDIQWSRMMQDTGRFPHQGQHFALSVLILRLPRGDDAVSAHGPA